MHICSLVLSIIAKIGRELDQKKLVERKTSTYIQNIEQLCPSCGPVFSVVKISYILTTCPYFDNLEFDIFDKGSLQCHFIMSFTIAVRIPTLSVH